MKKLFNKNLWKYLIAFLIPTVLVISFCDSVDNDTWFVAAEGREIVEHGIYYTDQLSMHEGLEVAVQNYGFAVIFYLIYNFLGTPGLYMTTIILNFIFMLLFYKLCMLLSGKNTKLSLILTAVADSLLALGFIVTRAQMIDYIVLTALFYILELYIKTSKTKYLWWIPVFSLLIINLHATTWWMLFIIILVYLIDGIKNPLFHLHGYKKKPIILITLLSLLLGFINPYGLKMITLIFTSYGSPVLSDLVGEMHPFSFFSSVDIVFFLFLISTISLYIFAKRKIKIRHLLLFFGFLALGLNTTKALSELILVMIFPLSDVYRDWVPQRAFDVPKIGRVFTAWTGIVVLALSVASITVVLLTMKNAPSPELFEAFLAIDDSVGDKKKEDLKIYVGYNHGGYAEFKGYHPYLDPRAEVFLKRNNHKKDIIEEWQNLERGDIKINDFLLEYDFDYIVAEGNDKLYELDHPSYELLYGSDEPSNLIRVYKKVGAIQEVK